ncbi:MAG: PspC domain-containing protein [Bacteroidaceae bacterium]|nr:PspC domain-containing protein [Bacteroidaceae bacterium]
MVQRRLLRSVNDRWLAGVCGGIADYFGWNSDLLRLVWVVLSVCTAFCGGIVYIVLWILMPREGGYQIS